MNKKPTELPMSVFGGPRPGETVVAEMMLHFTLSDGTPVVVPIRSRAENHPSKKWDNRMHRTEEWRRKQHLQLDRLRRLGKKVD